MGIDNTHRLEVDPAWYCQKFYESEMKRSLPLEYADRVQPTRCQVALMRRLLHFVTPLGVTPGGPYPQEAFRKARTFPGPRRDRQSAPARGWIQAAKAISRILFQRPCKVVIWCSSGRGTGVRFLSAIWGRRKL